MHVNLPTFGNEKPEVILRGVKQAEELNKSNIRKDRIQIHWVQVEKD